MDELRQRIESICIDRGMFSDGQTVWISLESLMPFLLANYEVDEIVEYCCRLNGTDVEDEFMGGTYWRTFINKFLAKVK